jgi:hypothetical protein
VQAAACEKLFYRMRWLIYDKNGGSEWHAIVNSLPFEKASKPKRFE